MKIILAGSPEISVKTFEKVINNFEVVAIITQPDKPKGRGMNIESTPVAKLGEKYNIKTYKPNKISEIYDELSEIDFDLFLTFAFGQWIPTNILKLGKYKPMNIHGSLLPKYRGAAPIHHAILNNDSEIGITFMEMVKEMDAGDMFFKAKRTIDENVTTGEGFKIIDDLAEENIVSWIQSIDKGEVNPISQGENWTHAPKIEKTFAELQTSLSIEEAFRKVKAMNPFPGAFTFIDGKRVKIFNVTKTPTKGSIELVFSNGKLYVVEYQIEGKKKVVIEY